MGREPGWLCRTTWGESRAGYDEPRGSPALLTSCLSAVGTNLVSRPSFTIVQACYLIGVGGGMGCPDNLLTLRVGISLSLSLSCVCVCVCTRARARARVCVCVCVLLNVHGGEKAY